MADATTRQTSPAVEPVDPRPASVNAKTAVPPRSPAKGAAIGAHAAAATFDEILASEARANLKRSRAAAYDEMTKYKPRSPLPPAKIIVRPSRAHAWMTPFISLAVVVGISTFVSAGAIAYLFLRPIAAATAAEAEIRGLRDALSQLRRNVAELSVNVATNRNVTDAASKTATDRAERMATNLDRVERIPSIPAMQTDPTAVDARPIARTAAIDTTADVTGTVQPSHRPANTSREVLAGWHIRRAYDGGAVLEGKLGVIEVSLGQDVPSLGRIQEIKYENSRWQVLTSRGVILSTR